MNGTLEATVVDGRVKTRCPRCAAPLAEADFERDECPLCLAPVGGRP
ncbi:MAG: hypothetical protein L3K23_10465 [Thermoplasmata archaeon]|nr:hypothetical protein [Thermoplasmata archaeon]